MEGSTMESFAELVERLPRDPVRLPLCAENPDWDTLLRPLQVWICLFPELGLTPEQVSVFVSVILESAYTLGYQRGQQTKPMTFVVGNPEEKNNA